MQKKARLGRQDQGSTRRNTLLRRSLHALPSRYSVVKKPSKNGDFACQTATNRIVPSFSPALSAGGAARRPYALRPTRFSACRLASLVFSIQAFAAYSTAPNGKPLRQVGACGRKAHRGCRLLLYISNIDGSRGKLVILEKYFKGHRPWSRNASLPGWCSSRALWWAVGACGQYQVAIECRVQPFQIVPP